MLNLQGKITVNKQTIDSPNLCDRFGKQDLDSISAWVVQNYEEDKQSRTDWERRMSNALDLAMQVQKDKTFPWPGSSNVAFPLVTIAALQFHSRAYPSIINGNSVVQCKNVGPATEAGTRRAALISQHMSWQVLEQDEAWEEQMDRALLYVAIVGSGYKKSYYDANLGHNISEFVSSYDLVVNYWAKSIDSAPIKTHVVPMYRNDVYTRCKNGAYRDVTEEPWFCADQPVPEIGQVEAAQDNRAGVNQPSTSSVTPFTLLEQHCWLDLDDDGYAEPYIVTVDKGSGEVLRIVMRCNRIEDVQRNANDEIVKINATEYFTKIPFIPSPDGSIYDVGFGVLLGPLNESVNSAINQLFDAGTLANTSGGFLGRGAKIRGGVYQFQPFGWNRVDSTGDDLRKSVFPMPVREPSNVMFQLLGLLIDYTNRIAGASDMMVGENPGQNTPAETSRALIAQGEKVYSAIFKRVWRSMKLEFRKLFMLNCIYLPTRSNFGDGGEILREDYTAGAANILPAADPTIASEGQRYAQARLLREASQSAAGYDADEVERRYLRAIGIPDVETVFPGSANMAPPPPDVKVQIQEMKNQVEMARLQQEQMKFALTMQETARLNSAKILQLEAQARDMDAKAQNEGAKQNVAAFRAGIEAMREQNNAINLQLDRIMQGVKDGQGMGGALPSLDGGSSNTGVDALGIPAA